MTDLRYPIGKFDAAAPVTPLSRDAAITAISQVPASLRAAVRGLTDGQLDSPYRPEGWTVRQLVHHMADSHMNAFMRLRLALTEDNPTIKPYKEGLWAQLSDSTTSAIEPSLHIIDGVHARWVAVLRALRPDDFTRTIVHPERAQPLSIDFQTALYAWHGQHHVRHITALRERERW